VARRLLTLVYLVVGAIVASEHHYYAHLSTTSQIASAALATVAWPLIFAHVNLHVQLGGAR